MGVQITSPTLKLNSLGRTGKKCGGFRQVAAEALTERRGLDSDIDQSRADLNIYEGYASAEELLAYSERHVAELNEKAAAEGGRKIRKDAVLMVATIIRAPTHYMNQFSRDEQIRFLKEGIEGLAAIIGKDNIKSAAYHFDEQGPHVHVFWEPMTADGRLCAKEMVSLKTFSRINKELPQFMRAKGWDIDDCRAYDAAEEQAKMEALGEAEYRRQNAEKRAKNGRSSRQYKADEEKELMQVLAVKSDVTTELEVRKCSLAELKDEQESLESELSAQRLELKALKATPAPESEYWLNMMSKVKKFFKKETVELSVEEFKKCVGAYTFYYKAKAILDEIENRIKEMYNNTVRKLKERLTRVTAERDKAMQERDEAIGEKEKAEAETRSYQELFGTICNKFPAVRAFLQRQDKNHSRQDFSRNEEEEEL